MRARGEAIERKCMSTHELTPEDAVEQAGDGAEGAVESSKLREGQEKGQLDLDDGRDILDRLRTHELAPENLLS